VVLAQDPGDALYPDMPVNTAAVTGVDGVLSAEAMPALIGRLLEEPVADRGEQSAEEREGREEDGFAAAELALRGAPSELSCPECGGLLWERDEGPLVRFACRVGHVFSPESLIAGHGKELERALWSALRSLEERADLYRRMARRARTGSSVRRRFEDRAEGAEQHAVAVREAMS
jgi:two-component system chemotaxis response regulator CheB